MTTLLQELNNFLFEYKRDITEKKLGDKLEKVASEDGSTLAKALDILEKIDPTKNKQYVEWLCRQYIQQKFRLEDKNRVIEVLTRFEKIKNRLEQKDINRYNFHELQSLMDKHFEEVVLDVDAKTVKGAKVLYNGPLGQLSIPSTKAAACELGAGTKWCTAAKSNNMFAHYNSSGPLYIWKDKSGEKYQFHFESNQFMDDKDSPISNAKVEEFRLKNPVTKKLFLEKEKELLDKMKTDSEQRAVIGYGNKFIKPARWKDLEERILSTKNFEMALRYAESYLEKAWPEGEHLIALDAKSAYQYAKNILKKKWPEGEEIIMKNRHYGVLYTQLFPKSSFKDFAKK